MTAALTDNQEDKILIRRPDGTFDYVSVSSDEGQLGETGKVNKVTPQEQVIKTPVVEPPIKVAEPKAPASPPARIDKIAMPPTSQSGIDWMAKVVDIIKQIPEEITSGHEAEEVWQGRLKNIILSRLKDVRDWLHTKETFTKEYELGGLGLTEDQATKILLLIENQHKLIHRQMQKQSPTGSGLPATDVFDLYRPPNSLQELVEADVPVGETGGYEDLISKYIKGDQTEYQLEPTKIEQPVKKIQPEPTKIAQAPVPQVKTVKPATPNIPEPPTPPTPIHHPTVPPPAPSREPEPESFRRTTPAPPAKPSLEDVKPRSRLMGPVEELKNMRLQDFRRLGSSTNDRLDKVADIIAGLADESFTKKVEGIKGWRHSPIYKLYIKIGSKSLAETSTVEQIITSLNQSGQNTLTVEEFEKITDFNKQLRY